MTTIANKTPKILIVDNYDSFTYNLVHLIHECGFQVKVLRNDVFEIDTIKDFDKILLSPGPGLPKDAGKMPEVIKEYGSSKSILGICLGLQGIAESFGAKLYNLEKPFHGVATAINICQPNHVLFQNLPESFLVGRYHSWAVETSGLPECLEITCTDQGGIIMGLAHKYLDINGVQFHPESIMTENGLNMMKNWINA